MMRFRHGAVVLIVLACSCSSEPAAPVQNANPRPAALQIMDGATAITISYQQSVQLLTILSDTLGHNVPMPPGFSIVSRDSTVASVDGALLLHANKTGLTTLFASVTYAGRLLTDSIAIAVQCSLVLAMRFTPPSQTLSVGRSFTAQAELLSGCGIGDTFTWDSSDQTIVSIDSISGFATAVSVGRASVRAHGKRLGSVGGIPVTVIAP